MGIPIRRNTAAGGVRPLISWVYLCMNNGSTVRYDARGEVRVQRAIGYIELETVLGEGAEVLRSIRFDGRLLLRGQ